MNALAVQFAFDFIVNSDEEDDEKSCIGGRLNTTRVELYAESVVPNMTEVTFRNHFRMGIQTFEDTVFKLVSVSEKLSSHGGNPEIAYSKQLMILLWYLSNLECFR